MNVLAISPHTDDVELSMGATLIHHIDAGHKVDIFNCTVATSPQGFESDAAKEEASAAANFLGCTAWFHYNFLALTRNLESHRQEVLDYFLNLKALHDPDVVYIPSSFTTHQDHVTVYREGFRAFKDCNLFGYEDPWNTRSFSPNKFVEFDSGTLQKKIRAVGMYESQAHRPYMAAESITALARSRAIAIGSIAFAEAFEVIREVDRIE